MAPFPKNAPSPPKELEKLQRELYEPRPKVFRGLPTLTEESMRKIIREELRALDRGKEGKLSDEEITEELMSVPGVERVDVVHIRRVVTVVGDWDNDKDAVYEKEFKLRRMGGVDDVSFHVRQEEKP
jgi:hypothetical protein